VSVPKLGLRLKSGWAEAAVARLAVAAKSRTSVRMRSIPPFEAGTTLGDRPGCAKTAKMALEAATCAVAIGFAPNGI
jgi:hypothetical protein